MPSDIRLNHAVLGGEGIIVLHSGWTEDTESESVIYIYIYYVTPTGRWCFPFELRVPTTSEQNGLLLLPDQDLIEIKFPVRR